MKYTFLFLLLVALGCDKIDPFSSNNPNNIVPNNFLSNANYNKLIVEIQYVDGFQPTAATVSNITSFLQERLNKTEGISIVQNSISSPGKSTYTVDDIRTIENAHRTQKTSKGVLTAYLFFADGNFFGDTEDSKVLGVAYGTTSMVIFEKTVKSFSGGVSKPSLATMETTGALHEFGHILGLVDRGTAMKSPHLDAANAKHCNDTHCLMNYTAESGDIITNVMGGNVPQLTNTCLEDLRGNGGK